MKNAEEFEAMLLDPDYRTRLRESGREQRDAIMSSIDNMALEEKMRQADGNADAIFDAVHKHFTLDRVQHMLSVEQNAFARVPSYESLFTPAVSSEQASFAVMRSRHALSLVSAMDPHMLALAKKRKQGSRRTVSFPSGRAEYVVLKGEMKVRVWRMQPFDDATDLKTFDSGLRCDEPIVLKPGSRLRQADFESLEYLAHDQSCLFLYTQMNVGNVPLDLSLYIDDGSVATVSASDALCTGLQMQSTLLRLLGRVDAVDAIEELLDDKHHFIRWHAMRELLGLDRDRAWPRLAKMAEDDPQPAVRRAAVKTLTMLAASPEAQAA
ncbi:HEAT repeat domain-containing protein [Qipengyuania sp. 483]